MARRSLTGRDLLFWSLFTPLIAQALYVRKTAARFPPADGASTAEAGEGDKTIRLLAVGDSIIAGVGARTIENALVGQAAKHLSSELDARIHYKARGCSGVTSRQIATRLLPRVEDEAVDAIIISAGVNNVISLHGLARWRRNIEALLTALTGRWPEAVIAFSGLPPMNHFPALPPPLRAVFGMRARDFDRALRETLQRYPQAIHIPLDFEARPGSFSDDGFHPSERSYADFGAMAADVIVRAICDKQTNPY